MAHRLKVEVRPAQNKDGSDSKTRKIYVIWHKSRGNCRQVLGVSSSRKDLEVALRSAREKFFETHLERHLNDAVFFRKHGITR